MGEVLVVAVGMGVGWEVTGVLGVGLEATARGEGLVVVGTEGG